MSMWDIEMELAAANPAPSARIAELPLADAEHELLREIAAQPARTRAARRLPRPRRRHVALVAAALAAAAATIAVVGGTDRPGRPEPAFAAELVRFAESSPLLLLDQPGWHVQRADEESVHTGEMTFRNRAAGAVGAADLNWRSGSLRSWKRDRASSSELTTTARVLDTTAMVYQYESAPILRGNLDITALWIDRGRVLEFRSTSPDMATFKERLASLERVDTTTWLNAMPASVVKAADHDKVVAGMLKGIPLPPGFDPTRIHASGLTKDRYQLGFTVSATVACTWFERWWRARRAGDEAGVREAIAAMRTSRRWPLLRKMYTKAGYAEVIGEYVAAMPSGDWYGRPLIGDVNSGLGCSGLGVKLPRLGSG